MPRPWLSSASAVGLRQDDGVEGRHVPADEVGEAEPRTALRQPLPGAEGVGAEGQHQRRLVHHRLPEVQFAQPGLARGIARLDHRDHVEVAAGRRAGQRLGQHGIEPGRIDGAVFDTGGSSGAPASGATWPALRRWSRSAVSVALMGAALEIGCPSCLAAATPRRMLREPDARSHCYTDAVRRELLRRSRRRRRGSPSNAQAKGLTFFLTGERRHGSQPGGPPKGQGQPPGLDRISQVKRTARAPCATIGRTC